MGGGGGGGGGLKALPLRFFLLPFKNQKYFTLHNFSTNGHITFMSLVGIFIGSLQYFPKIRAILVQNLGRGKKLSKFVSVYLKKIKIPTNKL